MSSGQADCSLTPCSMGLMIPSGEWRKKLATSGMNSAPCDVGAWAMKQYAELIHGDCLLALAGAVASCGGC